MPQKPEVIVRQQGDYRFDIDFGEGLAHLHTDEPAPIGGGQGPDPIHLLLASVGACMSSSFHFAMRKYQEAPGTISATARASIERDETRRLRVQAIELAIRFEESADKIGHLARILETFEEFCTVSASVRRGIPMTVTVTDGTGRRVK